MPDGTSGASSHREDKRTKVVRIPARSLMHPLMLHLETPVLSPLRTCPTKKVRVPPHTQKRR